MKKLLKYNLDLKFVRKDCQSSLILKNRYQNDESPENHSFSALIKWMIKKNPQKTEKKNDKYRLITKKQKYF